MAEEVTSEKKAAGEGGLNLSKNAWIGIAAAALVIGLLIGHFLLGGLGGGALKKSTVSEGELDKPIATYSYNGASKNVSTREVIQQSGSLDSAKKEDGNYDIPSADSILSFARNQIISAEADSKGIQVSDDDLAKYAEEMLGSSDFASVATSYNMDEETVKSLLRDSAKMSKLREQVLGETDAGQAPEAPKEPEVKGEVGEDGKEAEPTEEAREAAKKEPKKEYADYIIKLAGDEWDAEKGAWKSEDGPYATALADYEVKKDAATYEAANAAYYVAYQQYSEKQSEVSQKWTDYVNELMGNSTIQILTLKS